MAIISVQNQGLGLGGIGETFLRSMMAAQQMKLQKEALELQKEEQNLRTKRFEQEMLEFKTKRDIAAAEQQVAPGILQAGIDQGVPGLQQAAQAAGAQSPLGQLNQQTGGGAEVGLNPAQAQALLSQFGQLQDLRLGEANIGATEALEGQRKASTASMHQETAFRERTADLRVRAIDLSNRVAEQEVISQRAGIGQADRRLRLEEKKLKADIGKFTASIALDLEADYRRTNASFRASGASVAEAAAIASQVVYDRPTKPGAKELRDVVSDRFQQSLGIEDPEAGLEFATAPYQTAAFIGRLGINEPQLQSTISSIFVQAKKANKNNPEAAFAQIQEDLNQLGVADDKREALTGAVYLFVDRAYGVNVNRGDPARKSAISGLFEILKQNPLGVLGGVSGP